MLPKPIHSDPDVWFVSAVLTIYFVQLLLFINTLVSTLTLLEPLFLFTDGHLLTRRSVSNILHSCFPGITLDTHSFRIGGASAAASAGVSDSTIQILGRWSSDTYRRYLRLSDQLITSTCHQMSSVDIVNRRWDPELIRSHPD